MLSQWSASLWILYGSARSIGIGLILALLTYGIVVVLPDEIRRPFHAVLLAGIGAVYLGFALADGRIKMIVLEYRPQYGWTVCLR